MQGSIIYGDDHLPPAMTISYTGRRLSTTVESSISDGLYMCDAEFNGATSTGDIINKEAAFYIKSLHDANPLEEGDIMLTENDSHVDNQDKVPMMNYTSFIAADKGCLVQEWPDGSVTFGYLKNDTPNKWLSDKSLTEPSGHSYTKPPLLSVATGISV
ncbi:hypothetical protein Tco_0686617 [Tanacetum coccineum]